MFELNKINKYVLKQWEDTISSLIDTIEVALCKLYKNRES